jgi:hypothetical protein
MTYFVNLRGSDYGAVCSPYVLSGDSNLPSPLVKAVPWNAVPYIVKGKNVLLAAHGFNVSYEDGFHSLGHLEDALAMRPDECFLGVLWPGDWAIPAINYPFEDRTASRAGTLLGDFCSRWLTSASTISFLSHSLGARVILEAIKASAIRPRRVCITAGAVNSACLSEEYAVAADTGAEIRTLASRQDLVLELAYPPGDLLGDLLDPDHPPFEPALGRGGPTRPYGSNIYPSETKPSPPYGHEDYFPPAKTPLPPASQDDKWRKAVEYMACAFRGTPCDWP